MKDRIKKFMTNKGLTAAELADTIGVQRSNVSHIVNGRNKPSSSFIDKLLQHYPELDARWLITGKGSMLNGSVSNAQNKLFAEEKEELDIIKSPVRPAYGIGAKVDNESSVISEPNKVTPKKEVEKVIIFYKDKTFDVY